ncbi:hypothetical protein AZSI13_16480 [Azospira sp. I13]|uniref:hypothetical protein n=1 Tax=Azospira sp. I13 TaxID=1765050 RepID=UPI000D46BBA1|nr:hypothetical protein [Azospira sp. I13]GBG02321.1 hypothetical protein AZSI13_16480 [Azospira sp. I13]
MDCLYDARTECFSYLLKTTLSRYIEMVKDAHSNRGGIVGQRDVLKTTTAKRIRERMISDICAGAILPPVVIGLVVDQEALENFKPGTITDEEAFLLAIKGQELTIIDGMQRTAALIEASVQKGDLLTHEIRVEFWVAKSVASLIYRMLVLNTGQVPWTLARQLAVIYSPLLEEIKKRVKNIDRIFHPERPGRRVSSGQFSSDDIVELYLAFSLRKASFDTKETLSEEFSRLDFVDNLASRDFQEQFYDALAVLVNLDQAFDRLEIISDIRFKRGRDIFGSQPARIGFMVAISQYVLGRPGLDRTSEDRRQRMQWIIEWASALVAKLDVMSVEQLSEFLGLDVLSEVLDKRVSQVGRYERGVFIEAFKVLIDEKFDLPNMEPCWRAS